MKMSVIVVDMVNDFVTGIMKCDRSSKIIPNIQRLLDFARKKGIPVVFVSDAHLPGIDEELELWPSHAVIGTKGAEIIDELRPVEGDYTLQKRRYSAFYETGLDLLLRELKVDTVVLVGLVTNVCIQHTAADAFFRGYRIIVPEDCVESLTEEVQKTAIEYLKANYKSQITDIHELISSIEKGTI